MPPTQPELKAILEQVEAELTAMMLVGDVGSVTVHCGKYDLAVEVVSKRKHEPVLIVRKVR